MFSYRRVHLHKRHIEAISNNSAGVSQPHRRLTTATTPSVGVIVTPHDSRHHHLNHILMHTTTIIIISITLLHLTTSWRRVEAKATSEQQQQQQKERQMHPSLMVDTKYWYRNTEFGERSNWLDGLRPCSLINERVAIDENEAAISLGDAMDSIGLSGVAGGGKSPSGLKADIREFVLAKDGLVLLEEDTSQPALDPLDPAFLQLLKDSGQCYDSSSLSHLRDLAGIPGQQLQQAHWFRFAPHPDHLSWFNPANWISGLNEVIPGGEMSHLISESHQIPCGDDVIVFGSRREAIWLTLEANERAAILSFKVNFRAAAAAKLAANNQTTGAGGPLRVSKLKIGDKSYTQSELDQLIEMYGNNLFEFQDELSVFNDGKSDQGRVQTREYDENNIYNPSQNVLIIDESSLQAETGELELCQDEAGCECGNEHPSRMEIICSFNEPLELHELPCRDPITSSGYCNQICATSLSIQMDPTRFSERFLVSLLDKLVKGGGQLDGESSSSAEDYFRNHLFMGSRRVDHGRYEITMRPVPPDGADSYADVAGRDIEFAQLIRRELERPAIASFYGIRTINIKSSIEWRQNNRILISLLAFVGLLPLAMTLFSKFDDHLTEIVMMHLNSCLGRSHLSRYIDGHHSTMSSNDNRLNGDNNKDSIDELHCDCAEQEASATNNLSMMDLDSMHTFGSTRNLLETSD